MGQTLYLECDSGISGDMVVGALLDLGASEEGLRRALASLGVDGYEVRVSRRRVSTLEACDFDVVLDAAHEGHDHDMDYLYGDLDGEHEHHHHHEHRSLADIEHIVGEAELTPRARETALHIFRIVAEAESKAHGVPVEQVHFHEVGAVDSIVDVVSCAWCLDDLDVTEAVVSPLAEGEGRVRAAHGVLPVPVPAVANIVAAYGLPIRRLHRQGEFVTPTGAAIAAAIRTSDELPDSYRIKAVGIGSGKRAYDPPSTVRAMLIDASHGTSAVGEGGPTLWKLETEVDDCPGEALSHALGRLYEAGAVEAHYLPVFMKKGRPGYQVEVLCDEGHRAACERVLFEDTTTIGVRRSAMRRTCLPREVVDVSCAYGQAKAKRVVLPGGEVRAYPEYETVSGLARTSGVPYQEVWRAVLEAANESNE